MTKLEEKAAEWLAAGYDLSDDEDNLTPKVRAELVAAYIDDLGVTDNIDFIGQADEFSIELLLLNIKNRCLLNTQGYSRHWMDANRAYLNVQLTNTVIDMMQTYAEQFIKDAFEWARDRRAERDRDDVQEKKDLARTGRSEVFEDD